MTEERARYFLIKPTPENDIKFTIENYVCGACMGELFPVFQGGNWWVICENCDENTREYVGRQYKEQENNTP